MKKILLIFLFSILSLFAFSQVIPDPNVPKTNVTNNIYYNGWAKWGNTCSGCVGLYYRIDRINHPIYENGSYYYYFYIYFYSDSYYSNGQKASTYLTNVNFFIGDYFLLNIEYILIPSETSYYAAYIKSVNPSSAVRFTWDNATIY